MIEVIVYNRDTGYSISLKHSWGVVTTQGKTEMDLMVNLVEALTDHIELLKEAKAEEGDKAE